MTAKQITERRIKTLLKDRTAPVKVGVYMYRGTRCIGQCESVWLKDDALMCRVWYWGASDSGLAYEMLTLEDMKMIEDYISNATDL